MTKIAIIEDDAIISQMYRMKFEAEGFSVQTADTGDTGLSLLKDFRPDIVLLDLQLPVHNGDHVLATLRNQSWGKSIPVLILTNFSEQEAPSSLQKLDVAGYIIKANFTPKQVVAFVHNVLGDQTDATTSKPSPEQPE